MSYAYNAFDAMTAITRGDGLQYVLAYNSSGNLASIGIDGKAESLVQYAYKNGNGRLKQVTFANGHTMAATYNTEGRMIAETWRDADGALQAKYKYVYDGEGNIVCSIDICALGEYTCSRGNGCLPL